MKIPTYPILNIGDWVRIKPDRNLVLGGRVGRIYRHSETFRYDFCIELILYKNKSFINYKKEELELLSNEEAMLYTLEYYG